MAAVLFRIIVVFAWRSFHAMAAVPFPISAVFVWRGFHAIRINLKADPVLAEAVPRLYGNISYMTGAEIRPEIFEQVGQGPTRPVTVTISQGTLAAARAVAGPRGTSSLMERALKRELRLEAQRRFVQEYEREFGEITPEEVAVQMERLARAHAQSRAQASTETAAQA